MGQFQASLTNPVDQKFGAVLDTACSSLTITDYSNYLQFDLLAGTIAVNYASIVVNGAGTAFLTALAPGQKVSIKGVVYTVNTITSNVLMDLTAPYAGTSDTATTIYENIQEGGHDAADFTKYIKITITDQNDSSYIFTSYPDPTTGLYGDMEIDPPSVTANISVTYSLSSGDGVYFISLCVVPTWNALDTYQKNDDYVIYGTKFYKCIQTGLGNVPDTATAYWTEVAETDLSNKYCTSGNAVVICNLNKCIEDSTLDAFCTAREYLCDDDLLCKNKRFLKAMKLYVLREAITVSNARGAYRDIKEAIRLTKSLCKCC